MTFLRPGFSSGLTLIQGSIILDSAGITQGGVHLKPHTDLQSITILAPIAMFPDYLCKHTAKCIVYSNFTVHVLIVFYSFKLILRVFHFCSLIVSILTFSEFFLLKLKYSGFTIPVGTSKALLPQFSCLTGISGKANIGFSKAEFRWM